MTTQRPRASPSTGSLAAAPCAPAVSARPTLLGGTTMQRAVGAGRHPGGRAGGGSDAATAERQPDVGGVRQPRPGAGHRPRRRLRRMRHDGAARRRRRRRRLAPGMGRHGGPYRGHRRRECGGRTPRQCAGSLLPRLQLLPLHPISPSTARRPIPGWWRPSTRRPHVFLKGAALSDIPIEAVEIPFEDTTLPGYFVTVDDSGAPRPTIVHTNGYDSTIQEMYFAHAPAAIRRGYNVLLFDGPGQGRNLIKDGIHIRPDWENVVRPVIDYALTRPEIDPDKIALAGWSFGGFLAPRAASFEHRIAALVADPGQWDEGPAVLGRLP